jgi:ACS family allantoate permease-like MFS transporter
MAIPAGDLTNFKNVILQGFGFSAQKSLLYNAPIGGFMTLTTPLICYFADRTKSRCFFAMFSLAIPVACYIVMLRLPQRSTTGQLIAFTLQGTFLAAFTLLLSLVASNVAGQTKKTVVNTIA